MTNRAGQPEAVNTATNIPLTTPLSGLPCLVLDTETTGLRVERDRLISVGAVRLDGSEVEPDGELAFLVDPGITIPAASTAIHGISDADVKGAGRFADHAAPLDAAKTGRVVVGHNIGFDLAILANEYDRAGLAWALPPALDTGLLALALNPHLADASLETIAAWLGVDVVDRHSALGDAQTTARIYLKLLPKLSEAGVKTLGEAERFMAEYNGEAMKRHAIAGWQLRPPSKSAQLAQMDTFAYRHTLADVMSSPAIFIEPSATLQDATAKMTEAGISALLIGSDDNIVGVVTERDAVKQIAVHGPAALANPVSDFMSSPVNILPAQSPVYRAVARLDRLGIRHVAVTDATERIVGMVSARDMLRRSASAALVLGDEIAAADNATALARAFAQVPAAVGRLRNEELSPYRIAELISDEVRALTERAAALAETELGAAPAAWSLMVLGSAGRGESLLVPDQDNALIYVDQPDMADWAAAFGERVNELLDAAGLPLCKGGVMAGRPDWRHTPEAWRQRVAGWIDGAGAEALLNVDIFFDLRHVAGAPDLTNRLHAEALAMAQRSPAFIRALNRSVAQLQAPVGLFGRLRTTGGRIDIKAGGLLPIVALARAVALHHGIAERATAQRLEAAVAHGALPEGDGKRLIEMHQYFIALAMDQQLADIAAGQPPSYNIEIRRLDRGTRRTLAQHFSDLDGILSLVWSTLST